MNQSNVLDAENLLASCSEIKKTTNTQSILVSGVLLLASVLLLFFSSRFQDHSSSLYMGILTVSIVLLVLSVYRFVTKRSQVIYIPTQSAVVKESVYIDSLELNILKSILLNHKLEELKKITLKQSGNARIDFLVSKDKEFLAMQLFQYIPYKFEPTSEVLYFDEKEAKEIADFLTQK